METGLRADQAPACGEPARTVAPPRGCPVRAGWRLGAAAGSVYTRWTRSALRLPRVCAALPQHRSLRTLCAIATLSRTAIGERQCGQAVSTRRSIGSAAGVAVDRTDARRDLPDFTLRDVAHEALFSQEMRKRCIASVPVRATMIGNRSAASDVPGNEQRLPATRADQRRRERLRGGLLGIANDAEQFEYALRREPGAVGTDRTRGPGKSRNSRARDGPAAERRRTTRPCCDGTRGNAEIQPAGNSSHGRGSAVDRRTRGAHSSGLDRPLLFEHTLCRARLEELQHMVGRPADED